MSSAWVPLPTPGAPSRMSRQGRGGKTGCGWHSAEGPWTQVARSVLEDISNGLCIGALTLRGLHIMELPGVKSHLSGRVGLAGLGGCQE